MTINRGEIWWANLPHPTGSGPGFRASYRDRAGGYIQSERDPHGHRRCRYFQHKTGCGARQRVSFKAACEPEKQLCNQRVATVYRRQIVAQKPHRPLVGQSNAAVRCRPANGSFALRERTTKGTRRITKRNRERTFV